VAGLVTVLEGTYQPGDWIQVEGAYGEVRSIGMRAVRIVTSDDPTWSFLTARSGATAGQ